MAADRVFKIGELVEKILLYLPTKDLLLSKRINTTCRTAHDECLKIKKALFLIPGVANNTSDEASFPLPRFSASAAALKKWWSSREFAVPLPPEAKSGVSFNPLLVKYFRGQHLAIDEGRHSITNGADLVIPTGRHFDKSASCNKMFLTQPPLSIMTIDISIGMKNDTLNPPAPRSVWQKGVERYGELVVDVKRYLNIREADLDQVRNWIVGVKSVKRLQEARET